MNGGYGDGFVVVSFFYSILASLIFVATRQSSSKLDSANQSSIFNLQFSIFNFESALEEESEQKGCTHIPSPRRGGVGVG